MTCAPGPEEHIGAKAAITKDKNMTIITYKNPRSPNAAKGSLAEQAFAPRAVKLASTPSKPKRQQAEKRLCGTLTLFHPATAS